MANNVNNAGAARSSNARGKGAAPAADESWKAQGFINLYVPTTGGGKRKLSVIALKDSNVNEKKLMDWLKADPAHVETLQRKLILEFRDAEPAEGSDFDLS